MGTSIDALAVGLSLALEGHQIIWPGLMLGLVASAITTVGLELGFRVGRLDSGWNRGAPGGVPVGAISSLHGLLGIAAS